jgi:hypothetical protein
MWQLRVESLETLNSLLEEGRIKKWQIEILFGMSKISF